VQNSLQNFVAILERIEILPNNRMRWHFSFWNQTTEYQILAFTDKTYLTDEQGKRLKFVAQNLSVNSKFSLMSKLIIGLILKARRPYQPIFKLILPTITILNFLLSLSI